MIDIEEIRKLINALEQDLAKVEGGSQDIQALRDEVETLRNLLNSPKPRQGWMRESLESVHSLTERVGQTAMADAINASQYVTAIGRMLGL